jgi:hypothetical protein
MSDATPPPGLRNQAGVRTLFRVLGPVVVGVGVVFVVLAGIDFFGSMSSFGDEPTRFWMFFVGLPLLAVGGWLTMAGFMGAGARYTASEYAPVLKDTAGYLSDGRGILGVGRAQAPTAPAAGPYCRQCGARNDADARFCDSCGTNLG